MHWSYYVLLGVALAAAHFGGLVAGRLALKRGWSYSNTRGLLVAAIGIPYIIVMTALLWAFGAPGRGPWLGLAVLPILIYAGIRVKRVFYPGLGWLEQPPRES
jgi:hypothetical protein